MRQQTTDDRRLSAVRLNFCRRNRHRRHLDEQRERARRRPAVAGRAEPGLNRPRRRSRPGGPHGGRPADKDEGSSCLPLPQLRDLQRDLQRWYEAVAFVLAYKRCRPLLYSWLERAQTRLGSYGPDGAARQRDLEEFEGDFALRVE